MAEHTREDDPRGEGLKQIRQALERMDRVFQAAANALRQAGEGHVTLTPETVAPTLAEIEALRVEFTAYMAGLVDAGVDVVDEDGPPLNRGAL